MGGVCYNRRDLTIDKNTISGDALFATSRILEIGNTMIIPKGLAIQSDVPLNASLTKDGGFKATNFGGKRALINVYDMRKSRVMPDQSDEITPAFIADLKTCYNKTREAAINASRFPDPSHINEIVWTLLCKLYPTSKHNPDTLIQRTTDTSKLFGNLNDKDLEAAYASMPENYSSKTTDLCKTLSETWQRREDDLSYWFSRTMRLLSKYWHAEDRLNALNEAYQLTKDRNHQKNYARLPIHPPNYQRAQPVFHGTFSTPVHTEDTTPGRLPNVQSASREMQIGHQRTQPKPTSPVPDFVKSKREEPNASDDDDNDVVVDDDDDVATWFQTETTPTKHRKTRDADTANSDNTPKSTAGRPQPDWQMVDHKTPDSDEPARLQTRTTPDRPQPYWYEDDHKTPDSNQTDRASLDSGNFAFPYVVGPATPKQKAINMSHETACNMLVLLARKPESDAEVLLQACNATNQRTPFQFGTITPSVSLSVRQDGCTFHFKSDEAYEEMSKEIKQLDNVQTPR